MLFLRICTGICVCVHTKFFFLFSFFAPTFHSLFDAIFLLVYCERASTYKWFRLNGNCFDIIDQFFTLAFPFWISFLFSFTPAFVIFLASHFPVEVCLVIRIAHLVDFLCENSQFPITFRIYTSKCIHKHIYRLPNSCQYFRRKPSSDPKEMLI